jgi:hypothetical protein
MTALTNEDNQVIMFYCLSCGNFQYVKDLERVLDELNDKLWSNLVCSECGAILATIKSDISGPFTMKIEPNESGNETEYEERTRE